MKGKIIIVAILIILILISAVAVIFPLSLVGTYEELDIDMVYQVTPQSVYYVGSLDSVLYLTQDFYDTDKLDLVKIGNLRTEIDMTDANLPQTQLKMDYKLEWLIYDDSDNLIYSNLPDSYDFLFSFTYSDHNEYEVNIPWIEPPSSYLATPVQPGYTTEVWVHYKCLDGFGADINANFYPEFLGGGFLAEFKDPGRAYPTNQNPNAEFTVVVPNTDHPLTVLIEDESTDDGYIEYITWDLGDETIFEGAYNDYDRISHIYPETGTYTITSTVKDNQGATDTISHNIQVIDNDIPEVQITADPTDGYFPLEVKFSATITDDQESHTFHWDFGDDTTSGKLYTSHIYDKAGIYVVSATAEDEWGAVGTDSLTITVNSLFDEGLEGDYLLYIIISSLTILGIMVIGLSPLDMGLKIMLIIIILGSVIFGIAFLMGAFA